MFICFLHFLLTSTTSEKLVLWRKHLKYKPPGTCDSLVAQSVKNLPPMQETRVHSLVQEDPLEKEMATHSSIVAWKIPWMEKSGRLQSIRLQRVGLNWATSLSFTVFLPGEFHGQRTHGIARVKQDLVTKPPH